jgi:hypothetical protein
VEAGIYRSAFRAADGWALAFAGVVLLGETRMATEAKLLIVQFLQWVDARPRRIVEARAAWSSTCPLNCAWEDALADNMVALSRDGRVELTAIGRARLEQES